MCEASRYPFDFDALKKGDSFTPEFLEDITGEKRQTSRYAFKVLALQQQIADELEARGRPVVVATVKECLRILTDEEAGPYLEKRFNQAQAALRRSFRRELLVDTSKLTPEQREKLQRNQQVHGAIVAAQRMTQRKLSAVIRQPKIEQQ